MGPDDEARPARATADGILTDGSPFREILLRGTTLKRAAERVIEGASTADGRDGVMVPRAAIEELREAALGWSSPIP